MFLYQPNEGSLTLEGPIFWKIPFTNVFYQLFVVLPCQWTPQQWGKSIFYFSCLLRFSRNVKKSESLVCLGDYQPSETPETPCTAADLADLPYLVQRYRVAVAWRDGVDGRVEGQPAPAAQVKPADRKQEWRSRATERPLIAHGKQQGGGWGVSFNSLLRCDQKKIPKRGTQMETVNCA